MRVQYSYTSTPPMCRTACTEPQCLYKGALYLYFTLPFRPVAGGDTLFMLLKLVHPCELQIKINVSHLFRDSHLSRGTRQLQLFLLGLFDRFVFPKLR